MVLAGGREHDDGDLGVAEHGELARLLHDPGAALGVGHLPVGRVLDPLYLDLAAPHVLLIRILRRRGQLDDEEFWCGVGREASREMGKS